MSHTDRQLDDAIRLVPVPAELAGRLAPEALFDDAAIDRALGGVALPLDLADRVRAAARADVAGRPDGVVDLARFRTEPPAETPARGRRRRLVGLARDFGNVAAALVLAGLVTAGGLELSRHLEGPAPRERLAAQRPRPGDRSAAPGSAARSPAALPGRGVPVDSALPPAPASGQAASGPPPRPANPPARRLAPDAPPAPGAIAEPTVRAAPVRSVDRPPAPTMITVAVPEGVRRPVPRSGAFDLAFEMAHGEAPFVDPSADPILATDRPPLTVRTDGFDSLAGREGRRAGSLRGRPRVEEILAAMPPPPALTTAGDPAVRLGLHAVRSGRTAAGAATVFLEVAVHAVGSVATDGEPRRTTLLVDQSAAGDPRGWPRICRGVAALAGLLGPQDSTTVILCGPRPRVAVRNADAGALMAAASNWESLPAAASADLDAALELAAAERTAESRMVVVAHAVTLDRGRDGVREALAGWHRTLAVAGGDPPAGMPGGGCRFIVIDPSAPAGPDGPTFGRTALDATAIRRDLIRQVTGHDTLVARQCRLEVRFDPAAVARYRLVGHRQTAVESLAPGLPPALDLHVGETARAVYEVVPRQPGVGGLATASLTWRSLDGGDATLESADHDSGDRGSSLPSPHGCEILLATGIGEVIADSRHLQRPRTLLADLQAIAAEWRQRGDVTPFGSVLVEFLERRGADQRISR